MSPKPSTFVSIRLLGDELDPVELNELFGMQGSCHVTSYRKGERVHPAPWKPIAQTGYWGYGAAGTDDDVNLQLEQLLKQFPQDLSLWRRLSERFKIVVDVHYDIGYFAELTVTPETMALLSERNISLNVLLDAEKRS